VTEYTGMTAAELDFSTDETEVIQAWRVEALERAGYLPSEAAELAVRHDIDLHCAVDLVKRGCPSDLALKILL
jgi:ABC-type phosphate/phosphonate transport system substrate-binding protein